MHSSMSLIDDLELIERTILPTDPSFNAVDKAELNSQILEARMFAVANQRDDFLLSVMRLMALPRNGHTRLIPNQSISALPLRFATVGNSVRLMQAPPCFYPAIGGELISINGVGIDDLERLSTPFLAGMSQRKRVIRPILFVWPSALVRLGVNLRGDTLEYQMRDVKGMCFSISLDSSKAVCSTDFYPSNEHGKTDASWSPCSLMKIKSFDPVGLLIVLPSFFDPIGTDLADAISEAAGCIASSPETHLVIDIRGNTGGNFLQTLPLIDAIVAGAKWRQVRVLVDKFTFSAAIVFVAILKHRLGARLKLIGEEMGDGLKFHAEGSTLRLPFSGAAVRYSTALHDWEEGRVDHTTPPEIANVIVPVGTLEIDRIWTENSDDDEARDSLCRDILRDLNS
ncbi:hypothetical protein SAMN05444003_0737 [Cognatiyoonia sediminum]|uniref:Peptidase family S41 n=2 Tax=Cognatiyoonia sediminum TaxID=1508389 RepID=A0A1M5MB61_9RHOB|nr:hypothetical protein SAMN05444003_0737 [Cognatiyoonia sediminum]